MSAIRKSVFVCAGLLLIGATPDAEAGVIHVPDDYPTIQGGVDASASGDSVIVAPGVYQENVGMNDGVTLLGSGAAVTTIDGGGNGHVVVFNLACGTISGFTIRNSGNVPGFAAGIFSSQCSIVVEDCIVTSNNHGITLSSNSFGIIVGNRITNTTGLGNGINVMTSSDGFIMGNLITGNRKGIQISGGSPALVNNTVVNNSSFGVQCNPVTSQLITNNIISGNTFGIIAVGGTESPVPLLDISYNDVWNNLTANYWEEYGTIPGPFVSQPFLPLPGTGEISTDPVFADASAGDFRLTMLSPCVDAGNPDTTGLQLPAEDLAGNERILDGDGDNSAVIDMGAYEFVMGSVPVADIKPGSCPNPFNRELFEFSQGDNPRKGGVLPVAILGSASFDVKDIDVSTILLEGVAPLSQGGGPKVGDVSTPVQDPKEDCDCTEDGPDGFDDLHMKFRAQEVAAAIGPGVHKEERLLTLTFETLDGAPFEVQDCIRFVGADPKAPPPIDLGSSILNPAYPNPFNPVTRIGYVLPAEAHVRLTVYDVRGKLIERLVTRVMPAGQHVSEWDAKGAPSGIYFYRLEAGDYTRTRKMILLK